MLYASIQTLFIAMPTICMPFNCLVTKYGIDQTFGRYDGNVRNQTILLVVIAVGVFFSPIRLPTQQLDCTDKSLF